MELGQHPYTKPNRVREFTLDQPPTPHYSQWLMTTLRNTGAALAALATIVAVSVFALGQLQPGGDTPSGPSVQTTAPQSANHLAANNAGFGDMTKTTSESASGLTADQLGALALKQIEYPWEKTLPGWDIEFIAETDGPMGLTYTRKKLIEVYVRPNQSVDFLAHVIAHEIGHAVDVSINDGGDRERWQQARRISDAPWWPESGANDFATGAGDFAESFAVWQTGPATFRSKIGSLPSESHQELLAELSEPNQ